ncbi:hypothetical protein [uncultured Maritimibacter sp.]|jgi:hypothetical protein|uniref:hypothetical protein n=1 Tax=uncultured Maritimibacter sp. TaxID=991866 RepID=UPI000AF72376|nr:hypothetical protein [uncultured Maritimibacter sp.]
MSKRPFAELPAPQQAGILCGQGWFGVFLADHFKHYGEPADFVREYCDVPSRRDLTTDASAREKWLQLVSEFDAWRGAVPKPDDR